MITVRSIVLIGDTTSSLKLSKDEREAKNISLTWDGGGGIRPRMTGNIRMNMSRSDQILYVLYDETAHRTTDSVYQSFDESKILFAVETIRVSGNANIFLWAYGFECLVRGDTLSARASMRQSLMRLNETIRVSACDGAEINFLGLMNKFLFDRLELCVASSGKIRFPPNLRGPTSLTAVLDSDGNNSLISNVNVLKEMTISATNTANVDGISIADRGIATVLNNRVLIGPSVRVEKSKELQDFYDNVVLTKSNSRDLADLIQDEEDEDFDPSAERKKRNKNSPKTDKGKSRTGALVLWKPDADHKTTDSTIKHEDQTHASFQQQEDDVRHANSHYRRIYYDDFDYYEDEDPFEDNPFQPPSRDNPFADPSAERDPIRIDLTHEEDPDDDDASMDLIANELIQEVIDTQPHLAQEFIDRHNNVVALRLSEREAEKERTRKENQQRKRQSDRLIELDAKKRKTKLLLKHEAEKERKLVQDEHTLFCENQPPSMNCTVCLGTLGAKRGMLIPCGHASFCYDPCARSVFVKNKGRCPICRANIADVNVAYI